MNRVIVITGGSSGIGKAIAAVFAQNGDHAVIIGWREDTLRVAAAEIGSNCDWQSADVSQRQQVEGAMRAGITDLRSKHDLEETGAFARDIVQKYQTTRLNESQHPHRSATVGCTALRHISSARERSQKCCQN